MMAAMNTPNTATLDAPPSLVNIAHIVYALHALGLALGAFGAASVLGSFLFGWPSIIAVILNYVKRSEARGTWVESHYRWQIRTFWFSIGWMLLAALLVFTLVFIPISVGIFVTVTIWLIYRIGKGWMRLRDRLPMYE